MDKRWPQIISNTELWNDNAEKPSILRITIRKWKWIGQPLSKTVESTEKQHWIGIHMQPAEEDQSKPRKGPFCRRRKMQRSMQRG